ncbi:hypothetical protein [Pectinatus brassicae]|uniref:Uncharacterized protein n=1 Tax=Pectinatus brassicae TaxID=862415 RepID=A0A840UX58_9FIRM|nr:hypothetical protein [Pectinatus brassicae]MBB5337453.1 hypothetical protein [Pectinatus brassicae]
MKVNNATNAIKTTNPVASSASNKTNTTNDKTETSPAYLLDLTPRTLSDDEMQKLNDEIKSFLKTHKITESKDSKNINTDTVIMNGVTCKIGFMHSIDSFGVGKSSAYIYAALSYIANENPQTNLALDPSVNPIDGKAYQEIKALFEGTNTDKEHYNKLFAKSTEDEFNTAKVNFDYTNRMNQFLKDMDKVTGKSVIGNINSFSHKSIDKGDYSVAFSYNNNLVTLSNQLVDFMSNNRQDDDIWKNVINGKYHNMNEVVSALDKKGDKTAAQTMQNNLNSNLDPEIASTGFKNNYLENIWNLLKAAGYKG